MTAVCWRNDAVSKVTGSARYADDLKFRHMAHSVPVYADFIHARILAIRTSEAEELPGVLRIVTARDVPGSNRHGQIVKDLRILADDKIRYHGDVVAVVVAESRSQAIAAAAKIEVDAEPLPAVLDPEEAMRPDSVLVHEDLGTNVVHTHRVRRGDVDAGFAASDIVIEHQFQTEHVEHAYLEPESAVCVPRPDGVMEVYGSMQHPFSTRRFVSAFLGVPLTDVEIIGTPMGGGFGGKDDTAAIVCARTALAARLLGRPVKMTYRREWSIRESYKRHPYRIHYKMGIDRQGIIRAVQCRIIADGGAYCSVTPWVTWRSTVQCCGPYVVENVRCDTFGVYTNQVYSGAMRGFGSPQINFAVEQMVEIAAEKLAMDPVEFRRKNMVRQGSVTITGQKLDTHVVAMEQVLDRVLQEIDYHGKLPRSSHGRADHGELYGIGLAMSYRGVSLGAEGVDFVAAIVNVQADGSILLDVGVHENGQGAESAMILILAEELGVHRDRIRWRRSSTSNIPDSGTTVASRGTIMGGGAVTLAARELKTKIAGVLAGRFGCPVQEIRFENDRILCTSFSIPFEQAMAYMYQARVFPYAFGVFQAPKVSWNEHNGQGDAYFTWVYGCQAVELTIDARSGKIRLRNAVAAHDVGRAIHREMLHGQFYGGMAMGAGYALQETLHCQGGKIENLNFHTYRILRSQDLPPMKAILIENPDPQSPSGAKSIGEPTNELMAPAIANAVYQATGIRPFHIPILDPLQRNRPVTPDAVRQ